MSLSYVPARTLFDPTLHAVYVFDVPAGPVAKTIAGFEVFNNVIYLARELILVIILPDIFRNVYG
jgi:hypothetical protein